jgi:hypothetical protein
MKTHPEARLGLGRAPCIVAGPLARAASVRREFRPGESERSRMGAMGAIGFEQIAPAAPGAELSEIRSQVRILSGVQ